MTRFLLVGFVALGLAGCAAQATTSTPTPVTTVVTTPTVTKITATVSADVTKALNTYAEIKGIAQVDAIAQPANAAFIKATIAKLDPYAAALQAGNTLLGTTAISAAGLIDQAATLLNNTAAGIQAIPSAGLAVAP